MASSRFIHNDSHYKTQSIKPASQGHFILAFLYAQRIYCIIYLHWERENECRHFQVVCMYVYIPVFTFFFFKDEVNILPLWFRMVSESFLSPRFCDSIIRNRLGYELLFYYDRIWKTCLLMVIVEVVIFFPRYPSLFIWVVFYFVLVNLVSSFFGNMWNFIRFLELLCYKVFMVLAELKFSVWNRKVNLIIGLLVNCWWNWCFIMLCSLLASD